MGNTDILSIQGALLIGLLVGTLIEYRKENDHLTSVIRSLPYSLQASALLQSHGGGVGITSDGGQVVVSCGDRRISFHLVRVLNPHNKGERATS